MVQNAVDLATLMAELRKARLFYAKKTDKAKKAYEAAMLAESDAAAAARESITAVLNGGASTGDSLNDSLLRLFGLDEERIEKFLKFNRAITRCRGDLLMLRVPFSVPRMMRASLVLGHSYGYGEEAVDFHGYVLLQLSGRSMSLSKDTGEVKITLPATRYAMTGFDLSALGEDKYFSGVGPLTLSGIFSPLSSYGLWEFIEHGSPGLHLEDDGNESVAGYSAIVIQRPLTHVEKHRIVNRMGITIDNLDGLLRGVDQ